MAVERVTVLDSGPDFVRILSRDGRHCGRCVMKTGCGHHLLGESLIRQRDSTLDLPLLLAASSPVENGHTLELVIDEGRLMGLSLLQYGLPVLCVLLATAVAGKLATPAGAGEGWVIGSAIIALVAGLTLVRYRVGTLALSDLLTLRPSNPDPAAAPEAK